jgi:hypothetical protein
MPIPLTCTCGRSLRLKDDLAGRKVRCPECRDVLTVPLAHEETVLEALPADAEEDGVLQAELVKAPPTARRRPSYRRDEDDEEPETGIQARPFRPKPAALPSADDEEPEPPRRPRRRRVKRRRSQGGLERGWFGNSNAGIAGGLLMMLIALVWFFGGLAFGIIFFYPPVLFVIGIAAFIKGIVDLY